MALTLAAHVCGSKGLLTASFIADNLKQKIILSLIQWKLAYYDEINNTNHTVA